MTPPRRRAEDHPLVGTLSRTIIGGALIAVALALKWKTDASDTLVITLVGIGGTIIPETHIASVVKNWRGK